MSFVRPEIQAAALRWRESLAGAAAMLLGAYLGLTGTGAAMIIGTGLVIGGALLLLAGLQRARFRRGGAGPGVVSLDEGRLSYFGPKDGGVVAIADLLSVDLLTGPTGSVWILESQETPALMIPLDAAGADALFDVFGALEGLNTAAMLRAVEAGEHGRVLIWARSADHPRIGAH